MCGFAGIIGNSARQIDRDAILQAQIHRGPDQKGLYRCPSGMCRMGHNRLSIIDLSTAAIQPMIDPYHRRIIVFNGEVYNYVELRDELASDYHFVTHSDTEVVLAAYQKWGTACLSRFIGMFAFAIYDEQTQTLFAARDRFGVKPFYFSTMKDGSMCFASEIKALHSMGVSKEPNLPVWADYLAFGLYEHTSLTFWNGIQSLRAGCSLIWHENSIQISQWYNFVDQVQTRESFNLEDVEEEYSSLMKEAIKYRFRSDVPVGINLSGGLDSSTLLAYVQAVQGHESKVQAFTFATGDPFYDETPWVQKMLDGTSHPLNLIKLTPEEVPDLSREVQYYCDEPYGGIPTLAYSQIFRSARALGVIVLLDGQGMDEQWAGYDYYLTALNGQTAKNPSQTYIQASKNSPVRPDVLAPDFLAMRNPPVFPQPFPDHLRNLQFRDAFFTKIPRALRFNDRISMMYSTELREPFLDHRLFELAFSLPTEYKIRGDEQKWLERRIAARYLPGRLVEAPKRPVQTPQREWLRGPLRGWAQDCIEQAIGLFGGSWIKPAAVREEWRNFSEGAGDNSFFIWQWISIALMFGVSRPA